MSKTSIMDRFIESCYDALHCWHVECENELDEVFEQNRGRQYDYTPHDSGNSPGRRTAVIVHRSGC